MKPVLNVILTTVLAGASAWAQSSGPAAKSAHASVEGMVTKEPGSEPVKKALIELIAENQTEGGDYTAVTGPDGVFRIESVVPGRYHLFVERSGLLDSDKHRSRTEGRILTLTAGQELKDLQIRLQAAAVVRGRVTDEDGDPLPDAQVAVLHQTYSSGHSRWEQLGGERTNDLGEYRIANLPAGNYYVSVSPPPDFRSLIEGAGAVATHADQTSDQPNSNQHSDRPAIAYQTTYYPGTPDRTQATSIPLHAGDDFPVNFSLTPTPSLSIRGSVVNLPPHASASIMLQSHDFNLVLNGAEMHKDGSFVIRDVSPGAYTILATVENAPVPMTARQALQIVSSNVEGLRLSPQPGATVRGHLRVESRNESRNDGRPASARGSAQFDPTQVFLVLQSLDGDDNGNSFTFGDRFMNFTRVTPDGSFEWKEVPAGDYDVHLVGETDSVQDWFVKSALAGGREAGDAGLSINGGSLVVDVTVSLEGAMLDGVVADAKGEPLPNAVVVAVPDARFRTRADRYRRTISDQSGHFTMHGVRPGDYSLFSWESMDGEAYYNPEFLKSYEGQGSALHVGEGEHKSVQVVAIADSDEQ
jgi:protocatechuate 3,4-dioxygenase beta subunit